MSVNGRIIIVDIDGTIANLEHRLHFIKRESPDWDAFHDHVLADAPYDDIIELVRLLHYSHGCHLTMVTGRMRRTLAATEKWLYQHGVPYSSIRMRPDGDFRPDYVIKEEIFNTYLAPDRERIWFALDDRDQIVQMWRRIGIRCLQVKDGNY